MSTQDIKTTIAEYFKTQPVLKAWLFGSFARGEETPDSDVDILVEFDHSTAIGLLAYARMWRELKEKLGRDVDLVEDGTMRPLIAEDANYDRQLIYASAFTPPKIVGLVSYKQPHTAHSCFGLSVPLCFVKFIIHS